MNMSDVETFLKSDKSIICGAVNSLSKQFGWSVMWSRVLTLIAIFLSPTMGLIAYFVTAIVVSQQKTKY
ncbi:PspC domain-containing protein [Shewanella sp. 1_MG-2023]|uniref:PspC domain-containing protein n=1 Tax=Shewanella electrodiphila TaxID=934143 RepID=A0ABT0KPB3_9GAMM|nr:MULTISPECIES: PspC domain-containing protein [Shewanella]MCC4834088.1 PspC domain-containing protein [Shewanella sp. 10N.7]MCL1045690.1 PspC domain-containing protein [Shewanella electrodiphila]MDO6613463.1 PspC domain-containing protein [Shewanella sp. 7_MG-2023]MDO6773293.1 PspC domain-containing protein [Shewanella sp. 2_MG-2023]MDO6795944.1 PspC domain-containing protein [Shewanella sp. 1_MG-2023]